MPREQKICTVLTWDFAVWPDRKDIESLCWICDRSPKYYPVLQFRMSKSKLWRITFFATMLCRLRNLKPHSLQLSVVIIKHCRARKVIQLWPILWVACAICLVLCLFGEFLQCCHWLWEPITVPRKKQKAKTESFLCHVILSLLMSSSWCFWWMKNTQPKQDRSTKELSTLLYVTISCTI